MSEKTEEISSLRTQLKLLTPVEIDRLTKIFQAERRVLMLNLVDLDDFDESEKVSCDQLTQEFEEEVNKSIQADIPGIGMNSSNEEKGLEDKEINAKDSIDSESNDDNEESSMPLSVVGAYAMQYLKLLVPQEIDRLKDTLSTTEKVKPISLITDDDANVDTREYEEQEEKCLKAKILPLGKQKKEKEKDSRENKSFKKTQLRNTTQTQESAEERFEPWSEMEREVSSRPQKQFITDEEASSITVFILEEKGKSKHSQMRLRGQTAQALYRQHAKLDLKMSDKRDLSKSQASGVLVNKKK